MINDIEYTGNDGKLDTRQTKKLVHYIMTWSL